MQSMTGYGESHFSAEGVQIVCAARSLNSRFLDIELKFPEELAWFRTHAEDIIRARIGRGRVEVSLMSAAPLPADYTFNTDILAQYEKFLASKLGKKKVTLDAREYLHLPGFIERRVKNWRSYQTKFDFHLLRALIKMQRARIAEGRRTTRACLTHLRYLARVQRRIAVLHSQSHRKKLIAVRHRIYTDFFGTVPGEAGHAHTTGRGRSAADHSRSVRDKVHVANLIWNERKEDILRSVHHDVSEEISRIGMHIARMLEIFKKQESAGRELEFFLQELQREANTIGAKAQDAEINSLTVIMKTEIERLREQVRNLE